MSSGQIFVLAIIGIVMFGSMMKARFQSRHGIIEDQDGNQRLARDPDADKMREEIKALKERIHVLERIATDTVGANDLNREIEALRDK
jgi:hypothetical protein